MNREQLEHVLRAAGNITNEYEFVIVGSQSILGEYPNAASDFLFSMELDLYPLNAEEKSDLIDGAIGEFSKFHEMYGYYAQGVSSGTAILPSDWMNRVVAVRLDNCVGYCLGVHDLAISKLIANREKDLDFVSSLVRLGMIDVDFVGDLVKRLPVSNNDVGRGDRILSVLRGFQKKHNYK